MVSQDLEFYSLVRGDILETTSGKQYEFVKYGRGNFIAKSVFEQNLCRIKNVFFRGIVKKAPIVIGQAVWYETLKKGDYFYIVKGSHCLVFIFEKLNRTRLMGKNVHNGLSTSISTSFEGGKLPISKGVE